MVSIQHQDARKLLKIIALSHADSKPLTYLRAAELMGRKPARNHARAVAHVCNLLDAAACLAGIPLLALVKVRENSGNVNHEAWKREYGENRYAIINRSLTHHFSPADLDAISQAIQDLGNRGNVKAWQYVGSLYPGDLLYRRLVGDYTDPQLSAIDDLGSDIPIRARSEVWSYLRDPKVREAVLQRANGTCEYCGQLGFTKPDGTRYLESHHVIALANDGEDRLTNVIALCPNDHREAHFGAKCEQIEQEMVQKLSEINKQA